MAGFGSVSLTQTAVGTLIDQRAIVLYKQPAIIEEKSTIIGKAWSAITNELWGQGAGYEELFSGLLSNIRDLETAANVTGTNPYGITYIDAKVNIESDLCDHPLESGAVVTDAAILLPVSAEVTVAMPTFFAQRIYNQMEDIYKNKEHRCNGALLCFIFRSKET